MTEIIRADVMNTDYVVKDGKPIVYWFLRDTDGKRHIKKITNHVPHAWSSEPNNINAKRVEDIFGRVVYEWKAKLPSQIGSNRSMFSYTDEADILFPHRTLIDKGVYSSVEIDGNVFKPLDEPLQVTPVCGLFDFEFYAPHGVFPEPKQPIYPMVSNQWGTNVDDIIRVNVLNFVHESQAPPGTIGPEVVEKADWRRGIWEELDHIDVKLKDGTEITYPVEIAIWEDERDMFTAFAKGVRDTDWDVGTGYHSNGYDWPQFFRRGHRLRIARQLATIISPLNSAWTRWNERMNKWDNKIKGRSLVDMAEVYKKYNAPSGDRTDYNLKVIVLDETGFKYEDYGDRIKLTYDNDPLTFIKYAMYDVVALKLLNEKIELMEYINTLRRLSGTLWEKSLSNKNLIDSVCLRLSDKPLPTASGRQKKTKKAKGALVITPIAGLHEWVILLDLKTIYPSVMKAYNLSPEMKISPVDHYEGEVIRVPIVDDHGDVIREVLYRKEPLGLIPRVTEHFTNLREKYRELGHKLESEGKKDTTYRKMIHKQETVAKFLSCSITGVLAYPGFRLYDPEVFECVTSVTRMIIWMVIKLLKPYGWNVIYGDTDSIFVKLKSTNMEDSIEEMREIEQLVQNHIQEWSNSIGARDRIEIKAENLFDAVIWKKKAKGSDPAKKKYGAHYVMKDWLPITGLKIQGLEPKSSAAAKLTRELMEEWLKLVLVEKDIEGACLLVQNQFLLDWDVKDISEYGIPRGLSYMNNLDRYMGGGLQPWAIGCKGATKHFGKKFNEDDKPKLIYTIPNTVYPYASICITDEKKIWDGVKIDWRLQKEKILKDKFKELFEAVGMDWAAAMVGRKQTTMEAFFQ